LPENGLVILSVGLVDTQVKRMDHLVREVSQVASSVPEDIHLAIAGSRHPESPEIERLGRSLFGDRFSIFFDLERERMVELYRAADIFVLCSPREALGMAIIEAMSCGVPAICHTFPVMEWVVGKGGACVDMKQPERLASELRVFCNERLLRESAGRAARARVLDTFSADGVTSDIVDMYRRALSVDRTARDFAVSRANN
jgi:glycosyltransferase involved in cell wall biosynthesis